MNTVFWPGRDWWRSVFGAAGGTLGYLIAKRYLAEKESK